MLDRRFLDVSLVVAGIADSPAASPAVGTQYIVGSSPSGDFSGAKANQLARYDGSKWVFSTPKTNGLEVLNAKTGEIISFDGTAWRAKVALKKAANMTGFHIADYYVNKTYFTDMPYSGLTPGEIVVNFSANYYTDFYRVNTEGVPVQITLETLVGTVFFGDFAHAYLDTAKKNPENDSYGGIVDLRSTTYHAYGLAVGDIIFSKSNKHFYKVNDEEHLTDLGVTSSEDFTQIDNGVFFYYAATNSFYYVDTENGTFAVIPLGGSSETGSTAIAPIKGIVDTLPTADITSGDRYALTSDFKIHEYNGTEWTAIDVPVGGMFLNKADGNVYIYDGETFRAVHSGGSGNSSKIKHNFYVADYMAKNKGGSTTGYAPNEIIVSLSGGNIYVADGTGTFDTYNSKNSEYPSGSIFAVSSGTTSGYYGTRLYSWDGSNFNYTVKEMSDGDYVFDKATQHFWKYDALTFNFVDLGDLGTHRTTQIRDGDFFFEENEKTFYYIDADNIEFGKFEVGSSEAGSGGAALEVITETHTLTAEEATAQSFNLTNSIMSGKESNVMLSVCGIMQIAGVDYTASGNTISWSDKTLADIGLQAGDVFLVQYTKA